MIIYRAPDGEGAGGGGGAPAAGNAAAPPSFASTLPETLRGHEAFKEVKDVGDLASRYLTLQTPKPLAEQLPKEIAAEPYFKDIKDVGGLATKAFHQAKLIGRDPNALIVLPSKPEEFDAVYDKLGRPAKAEEYTFAPAGNRALTEGDKAMAAALAPAMHKAGLNQSQVNILTSAMTSYTDGALQRITGDQKAKADAAASELRNVWGGAYEQRIGRANAALTQLAQEAGVDKDALNAELSRGELGNRPYLARILDHIGAQRQEDGLIGRDLGGGGVTTSPNEARQKIAAFEADAENVKILLDKNHPQHAAKTAEKSKLYAIAYPTAA